MAVLQRVRRLLAVLRRVRRLLAVLYKFGSCWLRRLLADPFTDLKAIGCHLEAYSKYCYMLDAAWHFETVRLDGCSYFRVEVGEDAQAAGTAAQEDGQHPGPGAYTLLLVSRIS